MHHPPKPRLTLRVGVTGHRPNRLSPEAPQALAAAVRRLLAGFQDSLSAVLVSHKDCFSAEPPRLIVVSSLAEGTDRVVAEVAREMGLELFCPLPFARDEYEKDFDAPASRQSYRRLLGEASVFELDGSRADADQAYEGAGLFMLRQSDVVIAVWNGKVGSGRGGTRDIVQAAVDAGIPQVRFDEHGSGPSILLPGSDGSSHDARDLAGSATTAEPQQIDAVVRRLAEPPPRATDHSGRKRLDAYCGERERLTNNWIAYPLFLRVFAGKRGVLKSRNVAPYVTAAETAWKREYWKPIEGACSIDPRHSNEFFTPSNIAEILQPRFAWSDGLAVYYGQAYRSSYVMSFLLGAIAVFFAVLPLPVCLILGEDAVHLRHYVEFWSSSFALSAIVGVGLLVWRGRQTRRHEKWLDYRLLAERLRVIRVLALTGSPMPELRMPHGDERLKSQQSWVTWYVRATLREIGIPTGQGDLHYAEVVKCALLEAELRGQSAFHKSYAARERTIGERLEWLGGGLFAASAFVTVIALIFFAYLILREPEGADLVGKAFADLTMFIVAILPATGAALFSLRSHGEFERNARLSEAAHERLDLIIKRVDAMAAPSFAFMSRATDDTAAVLTSELSDWRFVFWGKPLILPG